MGRDGQVTRPAASPRSATRNGKPGVLAGPPGAELLYGEGIDVIEPSTPTQTPFTLVPTLMMTVTATSVLSTK